MDPFIQAFETYVSLVDWSQYDTAYGRPQKIPDLLRDLVSSSPQKAIAATNELWSELCHQHAYVSSAALPSYPVIIEVLKSADDNLARELLDIMLGFAICTGVTVASGGSLDWVVKLRCKLMQDQAVFERYATHADEVIQYFSNAILRELMRSGDSG